MDKVAHYADQMWAAVLSLLFYTMVSVMVGVSVNVFAVEMTGCL